MHVYNVYISVPLICVVSVFKPPGDCWNCGYRPTTYSVARILWMGGEPSSPPFYRGFWTEQRRGTCVSTCGPSWASQKSFSVSAWNRNLYYFNLWAHFEPGKGQECFCWPQTSGDKNSPLHLNGAGRCAPDGRCASGPCSPIDRYRIHGYGALLHTHMDACKHACTCTKFNKIKCSLSVLSISGCYFYSFHAMAITENNFAVVGAQNLCCSCAK